MMKQRSPQPSIKVLLLLTLFLLPTSAVLAQDGDGDGVEDGIDSCPGTPAGEVVDPDGCGIADLCPCSGPEPGVAWNNHGEYVSCVAHTVNQFVDAGLLHRSDKGSIVSEAAKSGCGKDAAVTEALTVQTFREEFAFPAGEGVLIFVDGVQVGTTGPGGTLTLELAVSQEYRIRALEVGLVGGEETIFLEPSATGTQNLVILMASEGGVIEDTELVVDGVEGRVLDSGFTALALSFETPSGATAPLASFDYLFLQSPRDEDVRIEVTDLFTLGADGRLSLDGVTAFKSALFSLPLGEVKLEAYGEEANGLVHSGVAEFYVGFFPLSGSLLAPPSNPTLEVDGLTVEARFLEDGDVVRTTVSDASGGYSFSGLAGGNWELSATTQSGELIYNAFATLSVLTSAQVDMTLRTTEDILNNVPPYQVTSGLAAADDGGEDRAAADAEYTLPEPFASGLVEATQSASVNVLAGSEGVAVTDSESLTVPEGTETIALEYNVASAEYPFFVLSQSIFNDVWTLVVVSASGGQLFQITRQVNSMIFIPPFWQANGTTGTITEELDVSGLTGSGDVEVVLSASATNIGDSILPTGVTAIVDFEPQLTIDEVNADTVTPTDGDSSYYSIPRPGETNTNERIYTLEITRPDGLEITNVTAKLLGQASTNELMTLVDEAPGMLVTEVDDDTLEVVVTNTGSNPSTVASTPPPLHNIVHRFTVEGDLDGATAMDEKDSNPRRALWMLPDGVPRKGFRDPGGDGWSAKGTYEWLVTNLALVPRVDDISGEHARDIGHTTHARGTDLDTFHFTDLTMGTFNGTNNYDAFRDRTIEALGGDADARATVLGWINDSRDGISDLAALNTVAQLIYHRGAATTVLPADWAQTLLETGTLTDNMGRTLDLGIGTWTEAKARFQNDHNNHLHIDLNDTALNNNP